MPCHRSSLVTSKASLFNSKALSLLFAGLLSISWVQSLTTAATAQPQRLADLKKLDKYMAAARADWEVPGMAVGIVKNGELVFSKGYGVRDMNAGGAGGPADTLRNRLEHEGVHIGRPCHAG